MGKNSPFYWVGARPLSTEDLSPVCGCPLTHLRKMWNSSRCRRVASGGLISHDRVAASRPAWLPVKASVDIPVAAGAGPQTAAIGDSPELC